MFQSSHPSPKVTELERMQQSKEKHALLHVCMKILLVSTLWKELSSDASSSNTIQ